MIHRRLTYAQTVTLTTGTLGVMGAAQQFSLNSLFDPDTTGVGHQPYGFDQFKAFYGYYRVDRCTVRLISSNVGASSDVQFGVYIFTIGGFNTLVGVTTDTAAERPDVLTWLLSPDGHNRVSSCKFDVNCATFVGRPPQEYEADPQYFAAVTASPSTNLGFQLCVGSPAGTGSITTSVQAIIEYDAAFFGRVTQSPS